jgi:hypothetical protein
MINGWWSEDGEWFCIRASDGIGQATISLRMDGARNVLNGLADAFNEKIKTAEASTLSSQDQNSMQNIHEMPEGS